MLDKNELNLAISGFLTRKQTQFPDLELVKDIESIPNTITATGLTTAKKEIAVIRRPKPA